MSNVEYARCIIVVGHGAPPSDFPRDRVSRLKALEGQRRARGAPMSDEERALDAEVRAWPRTPATDPYAAGFESLVQAVRAQVPGVHVALAYNEFCGPSLEACAAQIIEQGARQIDIVPSMLTPGGVHAEVEIPETIEALRAEHPGVTFRYAWPFDLAQVAALLIGALPKP
jgi:sirohydrochlorin cobaltochelatase